MHQRVAAIYWPVHSPNLQSPTAQHRWRAWSAHLGWQISFQQTCWLCRDASGQATGNVLQRLLSCPGRGHSPGAVSAAGRTITRGEHVRTRCLIIWWISPSQPITTTASAWPSPRPGSLPEIFEVSSLRGRNSEEKSSVSGSSTRRAPSLLPDSG